MNQCPYRIKDAKSIGWWNCQLEAGHESTTPHRPPLSAKAVEGIWHRPGEKDTSDPEPLIPFVGHNATAGEKQ
jgi:hypothetical protein